MPCRYKSLPAGGTFYALRRTQPPHLIFVEPRDYEDFEAFLAEALERTGTKLLGYCWMPDTIHLALNTHLTPLAEVMRRVTRYCSQRICRRTGAKARYMDSLPMRLPEPEIHLQMLLRYIHCIPVITGVANTPDEYPYTSHRTYARKPQGPQIHTALLQSPAHVRRLH